MLSIIIIDGVKKLVQKLDYRKSNPKKENVARVYGIENTQIPEQVLFESKDKPGVYIDEVNGKLYSECNGRWVGI